MNWDIMIGRTRQLAGRALQNVGGRAADRNWILRGEALEYAGRLQMRYGMLKHQAQWGGADLPLRVQPMSSSAEATFTSGE